jgi:virginiamycin B lyase
MTQPHKPLAARSLVLLGAALGTSAGLNPAVAQTVSTVPIHEWTVPWPDTRPRDPFTDVAGGVWFVGQTGDYMARLDPTTGSFVRRELPDGTGPHNLVVADDGSIWVAGNRTAELQVHDPTEGLLARIAMPDPAARDPHTLVFADDGTLWFSVQNGNFVGRLRTSIDPAQVELIPVPTQSSRPYGIVLADDGRPWFTEFAGGKIGTIDPETLELREYDLPRPETRPRRLMLTSDGAVWYVDYAGGKLGRLDPSDGSVREWTAPGGSEARPYGMAVDERDVLWFAETGPTPNRLVGFDPASEQFFSVTEIESGGGSVRHMHYDAARGDLWFGTDAGTIGRADLSDVELP